MRYAWTYNNWDGRYLTIGSDEYYRKTLVIRIPFTMRAFVFAISRVGSLYNPSDHPDGSFERWRRAYLT